MQRRITALDGPDGSTAGCLDATLGVGASVWPVLMSGLSGCAMLLHLAAAPDDDHNPWHMQISTRTPAPVDPFSTPGRLYRPAPISMETHNILLPRCLPALVCGPNHNDRRRFILLWISFAALGGCHAVMKTAINSCIGLCDWHSRPCLQRARCGHEWPPRTNTTHAPPLSINQRHASPEGKRTGPPSATDSAALKISTTRSRPMPHESTTDSTIAHKD